MRITATMAVLSLTVVACSGGDKGGVQPPESLSGPGTVPVQVSVPGGQTDGVMLVKVGGGTVTRAVGLVPETRAVGEGSATLHLIARGALSGQIRIATLCLPDLARMANYSVVVLQAAAGQAGSYAQRDISGYSAKLDESMAMEGVC